MSKLNLKAETPNEKIILEYLENNASETLREKINIGAKTLKQCWAFITGEARKLAKNGCAAIEDKKVFGWAIHFFEEDGLNCPTEEPKDEPIKTEEVKKETPTEKPKKVKAERVNESQISFEDFF